MTQLKAVDANQKPKRDVAHGSINHTLNNANIVKLKDKCLEFGIGRDTFPVEICISQNIAVWYVLSILYPMTPLG